MPTDLLLFTPAFPASEQDDTCMPLVQEYLLALRAHDPRLRIAAIATQYPFHTDPYAWNGIEVFPCDGRNERWRKPMALLRAWRQAVALARSRPRAAIHALWLSDAALVATRLASRLNTRSVLTMLGQDARDNTFYWRLIKPKDPVVVALSDRQAEAFREMSGNRPHAVIPFGHPAPPPVNDHVPTIDVLFCGSMYPVKDPLLFLCTMALVRAKRNVNAVMFGQGPQENVRGAIRELGLEGTIDLRGGASRADVLAAMSTARVLLHTARYEGQCYAFEEALARGMRIVSTPVGSAAPADHWGIAHHAEELAAHVLAQLEHGGTRVPIIRYPVQRTVLAYQALYDPRSAS